MTDQAVIKLLLDHLKTLIIIINNEGCNSFEQELVDEANTAVITHDT